MIEIINNIDISVLNWIQDTLGCDFLNFLFPKITFLGDRGFIWILMGLILLFFKKYRRYGIVLLAALLIEVFFCNGLLKNLFARQRPFDFVGGFELLIPRPGNFSFPSGHTMSSAVAATILTLTNKKFGYFAIPLAVLIAFSRMYLYVHYPTDILAAAILGVLLAYGIFKIQKRIFKNYGQINM